ncbi:MAG TPA: hypothetical protein VGD58_05735, partial [Herpetosiphonaceae bacterium]
CDRLRRLSALKNSMLLHGLLLRADERRFNSLRMSQFQTTDEDLVQMFLGIAIGTIARSGVEQMLQAWIVNSH